MEASDKEVQTEVSEARADSVILRPKQDLTTMSNPNLEEVTEVSEMTAVLETTTAGSIIQTAAAGSDPVAEALAAEAAAVDSDPAAVEAAASEVADNTN
jgi:hypothetical protein